MIPALDQRKKEINLWLVTESVQTRFRVSKMAKHPLVVYSAASKPIRPVVGEIWTLPPPPI